MRRRNKIITGIQFPSFYLLFRSRRIFYPCNVFSMNNWLRSVLWKSSSQFSRQKALDIQDDKYYPEFLSSTERYTGVWRGVLMHHITSQKKVIFFTK